MGINQNNMYFDLKKVSTWYVTCRVLAML